MTLADLEHFRNLLTEKEQTITEWLEDPTAAGADEIRKARELLDEVKSALAKVDDHSYGTCVVCKGEVELHRLEVQPLLEVCLTCITKEEQAQLESDLFLANRIYRALLPQCEAQIDGFETAVRLAEARYVGGDYFDFLPPCDGHGQRVVVADIMGKGIAAGMLMSNVQGAVRLLGETHSSPAKLVCQLNQWLCRNVPVIKFVSLVCLAFEKSSNGSSRMTFTNAGHCSPILIRKNGMVDLLPQTGAVIGVREDFQYAEADTTLESGDLLVLYTDGIIEAENQQGDQFGERRLVDFLQQRRTHDLKTLLADLITNVKAFALRPRLEDDYVVLAVRKA